VRLDFEAPASLLAGAAVGDSIAVNGVCLTAVTITSGAFAADISSETIARTTLGALEPGASVNLEASLRAGEPISGHFVSGHVDATARILTLREDARALALEIELPPGRRALRRREGLHRRGRGESHRQRGDARSLRRDDHSAHARGHAHRRLSHRYARQSRGRPDRPLFARPAAAGPGLPYDGDSDRTLEAAVQAVERKDRIASRALNSTEDILADLRAGKMVIVMDDEARENEGDLLMLASRVRPEDINFMARYGRGLICLTLTRERCQQLRLPLMVSETDHMRRTNFTVSIEAAEGVTTGISAHDRARTVRTAVAPGARPEDLTQPGHVFPLMAQPGACSRVPDTRKPVAISRASRARSLPPSSSRS
jgi:3,4-dihydroxy-2-butanone 4-phosphate synthase